jgi:hypothetical protein
MDVELFEFEYEVVDTAHEGVGWALVRVDYDDGGYGLPTASKFILSRLEKAHAHQGGAILTSVKKLPGHMFIDPSIGE